MLNANKITWNTRQAVHKHQMEEISSIYASRTGRLLCILYRLPNNRHVAVESGKYGYERFVPVSRFDKLYKKAHSTTFMKYYGVHRYIQY